MNKTTLQICCCVLIVLCIVVNFPLFLTMVLSAIIVESSFGANVDTPEDYMGLVNNQEDLNETIYKMGVMILMYVALVCTIYKPISMLFN